MKALSLKEPWLTLIAGGMKTIETRTWPTNHRGALLLCGSKVPKGPFAGKACCVINVTGCRPMTWDDETAAIVKYRPGLWAWEFDSVKLIEPFPVRGRLKLYEVNEELIHNTNKTDSTRSLC